MRFILNSLLVYSLGLLLHSALFLATTGFGYFNDSNYVICIVLLVVLSRILPKSYSLHKCVIGVRIQLPIMLLHLFLIGLSQKYFDHGFKVYFARILIGKEATADHKLISAKENFQISYCLNPSRNKTLKFLMISELASNSMSKCWLASYLFPFDGDLCLLRSFYLLQHGNKGAAQKCWERGVTLGGDTDLFIDFGVERIRSNPFGDQSPGT